MNFSIEINNGLLFDAKNPKEEMVCVKSFFRAISKIPRFCGHLNGNWTVGDHSLLCAALAVAHGYSNQIILDCLMHDMTEAVIGDIPTPVKRMFPDLVTYEREVLWPVIARATGASVELGEEVKAIDALALSYEVERFVLPKSQDHSVWESVMSVPRTLDSRRVTALMVSLEGEDCYDGLVEAYEDLNTDA